jgi:uncharacterized membrane protein YphA (DoxX/SURF4 family)
MNAVLWTLQGLLAAVFAGAGTLKLIRPRAALVDTLGGWVDDFPAPLLKPLGAVEVLAAVGLVVPPLVDVWPELAAVAAAGLVIVMLGAIATHARRSEYADVAINLALAILAVVVAWGRFGPHQF